MDIRPDNPSVRVFIHVWRHHARVIKQFVNEDGETVRLLALNWKALEPQAIQAVKQQWGTLDLPGQYDCPPALMLQARFIKHLDKQVWLTLSEALAAVGENSRAGYVWLQAHIDAGNLDVICCPAEPVANGAARRYLRETQVLRLPRYAALA